ncbi:MAG TPA: type II toxin-antitoxin system RelB/DinJ family antitoxin [Clostridia bacterium]|jgi:addiction module RelB/DinJ family antitoxin|nr:type II toxin-antitoxin system RelB/DinJ family antitoxin [Clostridia bacterium]
MAQATFSVRMDAILKREFEELCNEFGMNMSTAINVFARAVVREKKIPFEIAAPKELTRESLMSSFLEERKRLKETDVSDMSMDEIDEEIRRARYSE